MTPDKTPTDALAQLRHLYANLTNGEVRDTASAKRIAEGLLSPAIAALEKWGSPVVAGEPFCYVSVNKQGDITRTIKRKDRWTNIPLYTAPQPTQAQAGAVPLTPSQYNIALGCATDIPPSRYEAVTRAIERAHGIKEGGQHG